jgi:hypothetical protein
MQILKKLWFLFLKSIKKSWKCFLMDSIEAVRFETTQASAAFTYIHLKHWRCSTQVHTLLFQSMWKKIYILKGTRLLAVLQDFTALALQLVILGKNGSWTDTVDFYIHR